MIDFPAREARRRSLALFATLSLCASIASAQLPSDVPSLAPMIEKVSPAVVNIAVSGSVKVDNPLAQDEFLRRFFDFEGPEVDACRGDPRRDCGGAGGRRDRRTDDVDDPAVLRDIDLDAVAEHVEPVDLLHVAQMVRAVDQDVVDAQVERREAPTSRARTPPRARLHRTRRWMAAGRRSSCRSGSSTCSREADGLRQRVQVDDFLRVERVLERADSGRRAALSAAARCASVCWAAGVYERLRGRIGRAALWRRRLQPKRQPQARPSPRQWRRRRAVSSNPPLCLSAGARNSDVRRRSLQNLGSACVDRAYVESPRSDFASEPADRRPQSFVTSRQSAVRPVAPARSPSSSRTAGERAVPAAEIRPPRVAATVAAASPCRR